MRASTLGQGVGASLVREPDGSPAFRQHPATGHRTPIYTYDCNAYLDGDLTECLFADEEAGTMLVAVLGASGIEDVQLKFGKVEIRPQFSFCDCGACQVHR